MSRDKKWICVTLQTKATEQQFPMVLFMLYKVILTFKSVDKFLKCDWPDNYLSMSNKPDTLFTVQLISNLTENKTRCFKKWITIMHLHSTKI